MTSRQAASAADHCFAPARGFAVTHFLAAADQDRSRESDRTLPGADALSGQDPVILKVASSWLILNAGGGHAEHKPAVTLTALADPVRTSAFLNIRAQTSSPPAGTGRPGAHPS